MPAAIFDAALPRRHGRRAIAAMLRTPYAGYAQLFFRCAATAAMMPPIFAASVCCSLLPPPCRRHDA